jgi:sterol desaturase/sphingolipid hydroxylase (fatty acid hydroxylase superfamily)
MKHADLFMYAVPILFVAMVIEYRSGKEHHKPVYSGKDFRANFVLGVVGTLTGLAGSAMALHLYEICFNFFAPYREAIFKVTSWSWNWKVWVIAIILDDFTYYWFHRLHHQVRILWAAHVVHHSSDHFNYSTTLRLAWFSNIHKPFYWAWLAVLGFDPIMIATCITLNSIYQGFCHTTFSKYWDKLAFIMNTPGLHAIHHGRNDFCIDKNYSGIFNLFDKLFGTYEPIHKNRAIVFGVTHPPKSNSPVEISIHEFRDLWIAILSTKSWKNKLYLLLKPPGWKPPVSSLQRLQAKSEKSILISG